MLIKKATAFSMLIVMSLGLSACSVPFLSRFKNNDKQVADVRLQEVVTSLENNDKESLKKIFSTKALKEAQDLDAGIAYVMEFYKGKMISYNGNLSGTQNIDGWKTKSEIDAFYTVTTDEDVYIVFFRESLINTEHPEEIGVYMLQIIKEIDRDTQFDWGQKTLCAGVYQPPKE